MEALGKKYEAGKGDGLLFAAAKSSPSPFLIISFLILCSLISPAYAQVPTGEVNAILTAAETHFTMLKERQYQEVWKGLSAKTQESITDNVIKSSAKNGQSLTKEQTRNDFISGGPLSKAYWDAYLSNFNPDMVLKQSTWKIGSVKKDYAEVIIQYKKAEKPAILQLKKEGDAWKVGLEETFGILRWLIK